MKKNNFWNLIFASLLLVGCGVGGEDGVIGSGFTVSGAAHKGPYLDGATVTINVLAADASPTSKTYITQTDKLGNFSFSLEDTRPVLITADGYHFNELTGRPSDNKLTLRAIYLASVDNQQHAYVNVLTHLIQKRIFKLVKDGSNFRDAINQAQTEFVDSFQRVISAETLPDFAKMAVYNFDSASKTGNAYLLALSAVFYQHAMTIARKHNSSEGIELDILLNNVADDFSKTGRMTDSVLVDQLIDASHVLRPDDIKRNLGYRSFEVLGRVLEVADIDLFIDTDGDGQTNNIDEDDDGDGILDKNDLTPYGSHAPKIEISSPDNNSQLRGVIRISGTASEDTAQVQLKIGNGPYLLADGTTNWAIEIDTKDYPNGDTTITAIVTRSDWQSAKAYRDVKIDNPPIVIPIFLKPTQ